MIPLRTYIAAAVLIVSVGAWVMIKYIYQGG